jgi:hypothetical protein
MCAQNRDLVLNVKDQEIQRKLKFLTVLRGNDAKTLFRMSFWQAITA